jgi:hypothetical protein
VKNELWFGDLPSHAMNPAKVYLDHSFLSWIESVDDKEIENFISWGGAYVLWNRKRSRILRKLLSPAVYTVNELLYYMDLYDARDFFMDVMAWVVCFGRLPDLSSYHVLEIDPTWGKYKALETASFPRGNKYLLIELVPNKHIRFSE